MLLDLRGSGGGGEEELVGGGHVYALHLVQHVALCQHRVEVFPHVGAVRPGVEAPADGGHRVPGSDQQVAQIARAHAALAGRHSQLLHHRSSVAEGRPRPRLR